MILASLFALAAAQPALPRDIVNAGFEARDGVDDLYGRGPLTGWSIREARGYRAVLMPTSVVSGTRAYAGRQSLFMGYFARNAPDRGSWTGVHQTIDASRWRGRRVRASVAARPAHFAAGRAWLVVRYIGPRTTNAARRSFDRVEEWHRYSVELDVPANARELVVEIGTDGDVMVDDIRLEPVRR